MADHDKSDHGNDGRPVRPIMPSGFTALPTGARVDRYEIDSLIGAGGFGVTYLAYHTGLQRRVALKEHFPRDYAFRDGATLTVRPTNASTFEWTRERFMKEGIALTKCKHPGIVEVTDVFEANGTAYMALSYEEGPSLGAWVKSLSRALTQAEIDQFLAALLDALAYVHAQDMLHRDIAPDNIIIRADGKPCLIDFGAARQAMAQHSQVMSAIVKGGYSPPEQYTTTGKAQGPWSDIYALAATLYMALTGHPPDESTHRIVDDTYQPLARVLGDRARDYRPSFLSAIDTALRLPRVERPSSIEVWRTALFDQAVPKPNNAPAADLTPRFDTAATEVIAPKLQPEPSAPKNASRAGAVVPLPAYMRKLERPAPQDAPDLSTSAPRRTPRGEELMYSAPPPPLPRSSTQVFFQICIGAALLATAFGIVNTLQSSAEPEPTQGFVTDGRVGKARVDQATLLAREQFTKVGVLGVAPFTNVFDLCPACAADNPDLALQALVACKTPIHFLNDLKNRKVRLSFEKTTDLSRLLLATGLREVKMPITETRAALRAGVLDCVLAPLAQ